jgi:hypothetical protein
MNTKHLLVAVVAMGTMMATSAKACDLAAQEQYFRARAADLPAKDPCPDWTSLVERSERTAQELYNIEVRMYGRQAVLECRSRMSHRASTYSWCLEANKGRR